METITFILVLIIFILGLILGLVLPLILKKYFFEFENKKILKSDADEETITDQPINYTPDLLEEWQTGIIKGSDDDE